MNDRTDITVQASCVAIGGRALIIEGAPGSGKSSLALALIDRGAALIGDDAVTLRRGGGGILALPPPNIIGLIELRGVGLFTLPIAAPTPLGLIIVLGGAAGERLPGVLPQRDIGGVAIPVLAFDPGAIAPAARAEFALIRHGLAIAAPDPA